MCLCLYVPIALNFGAGKSKCAGFIAPQYILSDWSLDLFIHGPSQIPRKNTALWPFRRLELITRIAISVLPGTNLLLSGVKHTRQCQNNVPTLRGERHDIYLKTCTKRELNPHDRHLAAIARKIYYIFLGNSKAPTIAPLYQYHGHIS